MSRFPPPSVRDTQRLAAWDGFLRNYAAQAIEEATQNYPQQRSVVVAFRDIQLHQPEQADDLLEHPAQVLRLGAATVQRIVSEGPVEPAPRLHLRVAGLPASLHTTPGHLPSSQLGHLLPIRGLVTACTPILYSVAEAVFECKQCSSRAHVVQDDEDLQEPVICEICEKATKWRLLAEESRMVDCRIIRLQELPDHLESGQAPQVVTVRLTDDLVKSVQPGSRIIVNGILDQRLRRSHGKLTTTTEPLIQAIHIEQDASQAFDLTVTPEEGDVFRRLSQQADVHLQLARCLAPSVLGMHDVKQSILYALAGAPELQHPDGSCTRGRIHILIAGDPGVAKSKLLSAVKRYVPRCVEVFGLDVTRAGLGLGVVRDEATGEWMVEPGSLVLAHRAVCVLDELGLIPEEDRPALHSCLEEGRVSRNAIVKAELPAEATVVAAMNPLHNRFDQADRLVEQLGLQPALRSRFDLVWCLRDVVDKEQDRMLAMHQLGQHGDASHDPYGVALDAAALRRYLHLARAIQPVMGDEPRTYLANYFEHVRQTAKPDPVNRRLLDALRRLAAASARLRLSPTIEMADAVRAVDLMAASLRSCGIMDDSGRVDAFLLNGDESRAQFDRLRLVKQLVRDLAKDHPKRWALGVDVVARAAQMGVPEAETARSLVELVRTNVCYMKGGEGTYAILSA